MLRLRGFELSSSCPRQPSERFDSRGRRLSTAESSDALLRCVARSKVSRSRPRDTTRHICARSTSLTRGQLTHDTGQLLGIRELPVDSGGGYSPPTEHTPERARVAPPRARDARVYHGPATALRSDAQIVHCSRCSRSVRSGAFAAAASRGAGWGGQSHGCSGARVLLQDSPASESSQSGREITWWSASKSLSH